MKFANGIPDDMASNLALLDDLGSPKTYNHYPNGWAMAFNTPLKMWKRYEFNGGTSHPCLISGPAGLKAKGGRRTQYPPAVELVPTVFAVLDIQAPEPLSGPCSPRRRVATSTSPTAPGFPRHRPSTFGTAPMRSARWSTSPSRARTGCCVPTGPASVGTAST